MSSIGKEYCPKSPNFVGTVAFQAKARVIDGLAGSIDGSGTPRNQMHDWFVAGVKPIAWNEKAGR
jgi:hypothetical protein